MHFALCILPNFPQDLAMNPDDRIEALHLELPPAPKPGGVYKPVVVTDRLVYVSGHGPLQADGKMLTGRVGADVDVQGGYAAARQTGLAILSSLRAHLGSLNRIKRVVKTLGLVNCTDDFTQQPAVINGCSELFRDVWGEENGVGARSAVGMNALPGGITTEIEVIFELA
jgi:enamine deaminase RidA (YjgF/YER057c/UK114 family)